MANRIVGVDSLSPVSEELVAAVAKALGTTPAFWGRYFTSKTTAGPGEFRHVAEDGVLSNHGIRVLPIARQTNRVGGTGADGQRDGEDNAGDLLATFGAAHLASMGGAVRIFLDVEGSGPSRLSRAYYDGWVQGLAQASGGIGILPCVYGIPSDAITCRPRPLSGNAVAGGAACGGIWLSHPHQTVVEPAAWDVSMLSPFAGVPGAPVVLWQYLFGSTFDRSLVNPALQDPDSFLESLVLPPAQAPGVFA